MKVFTPQKIAPTATMPMMTKTIFFLAVGFSGGAAAGSRAAGGGVVDCGFVVACSVVVPMLLILSVVDPNVPVTAILQSYGSAVTEPTARASATFAP
jgi:hypothetical protein